MPSPSDIIDAEFVDLNAGRATTPRDIPPPDPAKRPPGGYGRRSVASSLADTLDDASTIAESISNAANLIGADGAAETAHHVQGLTEAGAETVRAGAAAIEGVRRELAPVGSAFGRLVERAKAAGIVGERRAPFHVDAKAKRAWPPKKDG